MVIDVVGMMEKPLELAKFQIEENVVNEEYVLLALGAGQEKGDSSYTGHRAVEVIGSQEAYLGDDQDKYHRAVRKQSIEWSKIFCTKK